MLVFKIYFVIVVGILLAFFAGMGITKLYHIWKDEKNE